MPFWTAGFLAKVCVSYSPMSCTGACTAVCFLSPCWVCKGTCRCCIHSDGRSLDRRAKRADFWDMDIKWSSGSYALISETWSRRTGFYCVIRIIEIIKKTSCCLTCRDSSDVCCASLQPVVLLPSTSSTDKSVIFLQKPQADKAGHQNRSGLLYIQYTLYDQQLGLNGIVMGIRCQQQCNRGSFLYQQLCEPFSLHLFSSTLRCRRKQHSDEPQQHQNETRSKHTLIKKCTSSGILCSVCSTVFLCVFFILLYLKGSAYKAFHHTHFLNLCLLNLNILFLHFKSTLSPTFYRLFLQCNLCTNIAYTSNLTLCINIGSYNKLFRIFLISKCCGICGKKLWKCIFLQEEKVYIHIVIQGWL